MYRVIKRILTTITTVTWTIRWEDGAIDSEENERINDLQLTSTQIIKEESIDITSVTDKNLLQDRSFNHDK